jgi:FkbM family methyltransferase
MGLLDVNRWLDRFRSARSDGGPGIVVEVPAVGSFEFVLHERKADVWISDVIRRGEIFDRHVLAVLQALTGPRDRIVDIGANIGWFTAIGSRLVGPEGRVFAFEPDPDNLAILRENVTRNRCENVQVFGVAAGSASGTAFLHRSVDNQGDHRVAVASDRSDRVAVQVRRIDEVLRRERIDVVKIDTQGSESAVLMGMAGLLDANLHVRLVAEFWPYGLEACGSSARELVGLIEAREWCIWLLLANGYVRRTSPAELLELAEGQFSPQTQGHADIVCLRCDDGDGERALALLEDRNPRG